MNAPRLVHRWNGWQIEHAHGGGYIVRWPSGAWGTFADRRDAFAYVRRMAPYAIRYDFVVC